MHDIDAQISKISGQANYMEHLQKITGNIMNVDMALYHEKHTKLSNCDSNIRKVLAKLLKEDPLIQPTHDEYLKLSDALDITNKTFYMHVKKSSKSKKVHPPKEKISPGYQPSELVKTDWFHLVKHMEKAVQKFLVEVFPADPDQSKKTEYEKKTFEELDAEFKAHPEMIDIKTILDVKVVNKSIFELFKLLKRFTKIIINILMLPMYDVKATIESHWDQIEKIFKSKAIQQTADKAGLASEEDIILILTQFIIAKYRATVTGNNKHYIRLFFETVGNDSLANMDGARFLEIMEAIDLDKLDKSDNVYKFASSAKIAMRKIANNEAITPDILKEFDEIFNSPTTEDKEKATAEQEKANQVVEGADIFSDQPNNIEPPSKDVELIDSNINESNETNNDETNKEESNITNDDETNKEESNITNDDETNKEESNITNDNETNKEESNITNDDETNKEESNE